MEIISDNTFPRASSREDSHLCYDEVSAEDHPHSIRKPFYAAKGFIEGCRLVDKAVKKLGVAGQTAYWVHKHLQFVKAQGLP